MKITELIQESSIKLTLNSKDKPSVIRELVKVLEAQNLITDYEEIVAEVEKRETHSSTGIGFGIAIPHVKSPFVKTPSLVFGRSENGIDYESMDDEKAHIFFLIAVPDGGVDLHLKALATLSRKLVDDEFREDLMKATTKASILALLDTI